MARPKSVNNSCLVPDEHAVNAFREALKKFTGPYRPFQLNEVAEKAGIDYSTLYKFKTYPMENRAEHRPIGFGEMLSISSVLGPEFTSEWLGLARQGAYALPDGETDPGEFAADLAEDNAIVTRCARDGVFDAQERAEILPAVADHLIKRGMALRAVCGGKA